MRFSLLVLASSLFVNVNAMEAGVDESNSYDFPIPSMAENLQPFENELNTAEKVGREVTRIGNQIDAQYTRIQPKVKKEAKRAEKKIRKFRKKF